MKVTAAEFVRATSTPGDFPKDSFAQLAFAGRSNVGKSTLINCLLRQKNLARVSSHPGKTRTVNFILINRKFYLVDLPGYGYAKVSQAERQRWQELVESFLLNNQQLRGLVHLIDSRRGATDMDLELLEFSAQAQLPVLVVATKTDQLNQSEKRKQSEQINCQLAPLMLPEFIPFSAKTGLGRIEVWRWLENQLSK